MPTNKWHGGKGSQPRKVNTKKYSDNWERIFGDEEEKEYLISKYAFGTSTTKKKSKVS